MTAIGDIFAAPWGRYSVHRVSPIVLRSLERTNAFIVHPGPEYVATGETVLVGSDVVPRPADPENGQARGGVGRPGRLAESIDVEVDAVSPVSASAHGTAGETVDAATLEPRLRPGSSDIIGEAVAAVLAIAIATPDRPTLGGIRPGCSRGGSAPTWIPCLTRARTDTDNPGTWEHCWFLSDGTDGSLFCETCRVGKPRVIVAPEAAVHAIRLALTASDMRLVDLLVQRLERAGGVDPSHHALTPDVGNSADAGISSLAGDVSPPPGNLTPAIPPSSGSLGHGGGPPVVEPQHPHLVLDGSDAAKAAALPLRADAPPPRGDDPKAEVGSFDRPPRRFVPKDLADWTEWFNERAAINQYLCAATKAEAERPGRREASERFARELAGPMPRAA